MYNVLICDDQPDIVNALKIYLTPEGYRLYTACNGAEAVGLVRKEDIHWWTATCSRSRLPSRQNKFQFIEVFDRKCRGDY